MNNDDPFSDLRAERTIIKPRLGKSAPAVAGRSPLGAAPHSGAAATSIDELLAPWDLHAQAHAGAAGLHADPGYQATLARLQGQQSPSNNPLITHYGPVLRMACAVRQLPELPALAQLGHSLGDAIERAEQSLSREACIPNDKLASQYMVCTFVDECAANTPWGGSGQWAPYSLLQKFFKETWGGEKSFALADKLAKNPRDNLHLIELMAVLVSLGFKGKYHIEETGEAALHSLRLRLFTLLGSGPTQQLQAGLHPDCWASKAPKPNKMTRHVPLWLPVGGMAILALLAFAGFSLNLQPKSDSAFEAIASLKFPKPEFAVALAPVAPSPVVRAGLAQLLSNEIQNGLLVLRTEGNTSTLVVVGDGLFASGQASLRDEARPLVDQIARALQSYPGQVTVTGYTDNIPIRSLRFPSNWQLSAERAQHVGGLLEAQLPGHPILTEGAGAANPIASNDTPQGRAQNRRVEISIIHTKQPS